MVGSQMVGSQMVGSQMVGSQMVRSQMVRSQMVGSQMVGSPALGRMANLAARRDARRAAVAASPARVMGQARAVGAAAPQAKVIRARAVMGKNRAMASNRSPVLAVTVLVNQRTPADSPQ